MPQLGRNRIKQKQANGLFFISVLGALMAFTSLSTDIYLPAMPKMHEDLGGDIELTVTGFLIGFSLAQLIWGPISDRIGRKKPLMIGLLLFVIGSVACALSETITQIMVARVVQAFGACVGPMLSRAMVRDTYEKTKAAEMLSTLMILMALAPIVGPLMGGQLLKFSSWHSIFWLLTGIGLVMMIAILWLPETLYAERRNSDSVMEAFKKYGVLLKNRSFMMYTFCVTFFYVGVYAFVTGSPAVYITYFKVDPQDYGWLFAINIVGIASLSFVNRFLVRRFALGTLLRVATLVAAVGGISLVVMATNGWFGIYGIMVGVFCFMAMNGIVAACTTAAALDKVPHMAGAASALLGSLQYGSGILSSILLAWFGSDDGNPATMAWIIGVFAVLSCSTVYIRYALKRFL
ncbi:MFS transporter, DHA1 family, bicyclomycin/chloramphenicol resistance protein [Pustulibacterium marinum]|uniref:MFS transporter, DHA1 family, bicyclomycin/chloramphenicol resistance protein n=1 Tax=Pustulibacterium marinum TaxID=1224947 RepID=A0A1I7EW56_9FLAO|nr:multidrug effflux MFS transporter [Pustulibacterium marinum]SFU28119.1 MFS transporter, DHA1 family, bicyclomycin/chloramphenicol resistance protein [Pustulibacterium marinum]